MLEYPENYGFTFHYSSIYNNDEIDDFVDLNLPLTRIIEVQILDKSFSYSSQLFFGSWRHYYKPSFTDESLIESFGQFPINQKVIKEIVPSSTGFLRFYPRAWVAKFSINVNVVLF
ncbi:MAG: hypothetical protein QNJ51_13920 [Calothrix sp. MO_167.B12]|nr:hypothetical protein [Calothrix sp. MO_167.B12]